MEVLVLILSVLDAVLSNNTNDTNINTKDKIKSNTTDNTYRKFDNMNTCEIDYWLKERDLYNTYGSYSREAKINKIVERNKYYN